MKATEIKKGMVVWIPCEVRGGPFPDERRVYVGTEIGEWFGFVNISQLEKKLRRERIACAASFWRLNRIVY